MSLGIYITIVLAMVGSIIGAVYKIIEGKGKPVRIVSAVIIILCVITLIVVSFIHFLPKIREWICEPCPSCTNTSEFTPAPECEFKIGITSITDGDILSHENIVTGTIEGEPDSETYFWLMVNPADNPGTYWPQNKPIDWFDSQWNAMVVLGDEDSVGEKYYIYVISVDAADNLALIENISKGKEKSSFEGIALPSSAQKLAKVSVVRN